MTRRRWQLAALVGVLLLAYGLRVHRLGAQSFWNDEGNSARLSERSLAAIVEGTAADIHPPLYYVLLRGWRELAGDTEFGLRALSAYAGLLTVAVVAALAKATPVARRPTADGRPRPEGGSESVGRRVSRRRSAVSGGLAAVVPAVLLAATAPVLVYYSQETRMYALLALLAAASTWVLLNWLSGAGGQWAAAYVLLVAAGLYTHYFFPAVVAAHGLVVIVRRPTADGRPQPGGSSESVGQWGSRAVSGRRSAVGGRLAVVHWLLLAAAAALLYLPWLPIFLRQVGGREGQRAGPLAFLGDSGRWLVLGQTISREEAVWALVAAGLLCLLGLFAGRRALVAVTQIAAPLGLMFIVGATDPAFFKFLLVAAPFVCLLMGLAWVLPRRWLWLPGVLTALVLAGSAVSLRHLYADPAYARADYRAMAARITADGGNVGVILVAPNQWEVFTYYHRDGAPVYPLPTGQPDPAIVEPELARIAATHERLYVLYWGEGQRDPDGVIERWLDANTFKASEEWVGDVRLVVYAVSPLAGEAAPVAPTPGGAVFAGLDGEAITLREFTVWPLAARPGDVVGVRLVWSADVAPARPYKVFLHLLAADGQLVAQRDGEPGGGSRPTTGWAAGEAVIDNHGLLLPAGLPPGEYVLQVGLYDAFDPATRLAVAGGDSLLLAVITVIE